MIYSDMLLLRIVSAEGELFRGEVEKVTLPTPEGFLGILPGHINIVTPLSSGRLSYIAPTPQQSSLESYGDQHDYLDIQGGLAMIDDDIVTVAAE